MPNDVFSARLVNTLTTTSCATRKQIINTFKNFFPLLYAIKIIDVACSNAC